MNVGLTAALLVGCAAAAAEPPAATTRQPSPTPPLTTTPPLRPTATPFRTPTPDPPRGMPARGAITETYTVRAGDTLSGIAYALGVEMEALQRLNNLRNLDALQVGQQLLVVRAIEERAPSIKLIPDSELVNGPAAVGFDVAAFVAAQGGYLSRHWEEVEGQTMSGAALVQYVANSFSVNPRLLLALLEHVSGWVTNPNPPPDQLRYPMGFRRTNLPGLWVQLAWAARKLNEGYYGWRLGSRLYLQLDDGTYAFFGEGINAGTAGLQNYLGAISTRANWRAVMSDDHPAAFLRTYRRLFDNPWQYDRGRPVPLGTTQPELSLPWSQGETWLFTGGPHSTYGSGTPWGALDFAPWSVQGCRELNDWVTAMADGVIARSEFGQVVQSLDPSGDERIGWSVLYLHIATRDRVAAGTPVRRGERIGHPSCEGGISTGAHVHVARKYNGEWINAEGDIPFIVGGWTPAEGRREYDGTLRRAGQVREACQCKERDKNGITW